MERCADNWSRMSSSRSSAAESYSSSFSSRPSSCGKRSSGISPLVASREDSSFATEIDSMVANTFFNSCSVSLNRTSWFSVGSRPAPIQVWPQPVAGSKRQWRRQRPSQCGPAERPSRRRPRQWRLPVPGLHRPGYRQIFPAVSGRSERCRPTAASPAIVSIPADRAARSTDLITPKLRRVGASGRRALCVRPI